MRSAGQSAAEILRDAWDRVLDARDWFAALPRRGQGLLAGIALLVAAVVVGLVLVLSGGGGGDGPPPADAATGLVPANALVYLHLSTDGSRKGTRRAEAVARRFPGFADAESALVRRLSAPDCGLSASDVQGRELGFALLPGANRTAGSLVLLDTGGKRVAARGCGGLSVATVGRFEVIGQPETVAASQALAKGKGASLAADPLYRRATAELATGRVADGWLSRDGIRKLLAPQSGLLGATGTLLDQKGLRAAAIGVAATKGGVTLTVKSQLDPKQRGTSAFSSFTPALDREVPGSALAYVGLAGLSGAVDRLVTAGGSGQLSALGPLLKRAQAALSRQSRGTLDRDLLSLFRGEVAVALTPDVPAPTLTVIARTQDEQGTAATLKRLQPAIAALLGSAKTRWAARDGAFQLKPASGIELDYAVTGGKLILATKLAGIDAARKLGKRLTDTGDFRTAVPSPSGKGASSLVFFDLSQLLRLGEQTGLNDSRAYLAVKDDLSHITAVGARTSGTRSESTAEIHLSIP